MMTGFRPVQLDFGFWTILRQVRDAMGDWGVDTSIYREYPDPKDPTKMLRENGFVGVIVVDNVAEHFVKADSPKFSQAVKEHWIYVPSDTNTGGLGTPPGGNTGDHAFLFVFSGAVNWSTVKTRMGQIYTKQGTYKVQVNDIRQVVSSCSVPNWEGWNP